MRIKINGTNSTWYKEFYYFMDHVTETKFHLLFSLVCGILYIRKALKKSNFSEFRVFHIFMYISIVISAICLILGEMKLTSIVDLILYFPCSGFIMFSSFFVLSILFLQLLSVSFNCNFSCFDNDLNQKHLAVARFIIMAIWRFLMRNFSIQLEILDETMNYRLLDIIFLTIDILILSVLVKTKGVQSENFCLTVNCSVYLTFFMLSHISTIILTLCKSPIFVMLGDHASNVYILPFLWIFSLYIVESEAAKKWIQKKKEGESGDFQLAYITVA